MNKRFKLLTLIGVLSVFVIGGASLIVRSQRQTNQDIKVNNMLQPYGVEVIQGSNPAFTSMLSQYSGGDATTITLAESVKPFSIFIKNNSSNDILGVSLRWIFTKPNGEQEFVPQEVITPGLLVEDTTISTTVIKKYDLILANDIRFFNYLDSDFDHSISLNWWVKKFELNEYSKIVNSLIASNESRKKDIFSNFSEIAVSIDGVIFADGSFIGPNQNFFFDWVNGMIEGRKSFTNEIKKAKSLGKTDDETLSQMISEPNQSKKEMIGPNRKTPKDSFDEGYKSSLEELKKEITHKKSKIPADKIIKTFLAKNDSDFIMLHKVNK